MTYYARYVSHYSWQIGRPAIPAIQRVNNSLTNSIHVHQRRQKVRLIRPPLEH